MFYWVKTNGFFKKLFSNYVWDIPNLEKNIYLTFDDGPIPEITDWVLRELEKHNAKATFFCIGDNIKKYPEIFNAVIDKGHSIGNHTFNHLNGWRTPTEVYLENTNQWSVVSDQYSNCQVKTEHRQLFRPPYGKIKPSQSKILRQQGYKIIMWDVLSGDYNSTISPEKCLANVLNTTTSGSIIVFHDSLKAFQNLQYVLPKTLEILTEKGYKFEAIK